MIITYIFVKLVRRPFLNQNWLFNLSIRLVYIRDIDFRVIFWENFDFVFTDEEKYNATQIDCSQPDTLL